MTKFVECRECEGTGHATLNRRDFGCQECRGEGFKCFEVEDEKEEAQS